MAGKVCKTSLLRGSEIVDGTGKALGSQSAEHNRVCNRMSRQSTFSPWTSEWQNEPQWNILKKKKERQQIHRKKFFSDPLRHFAHIGVHFVAIRPFHNSCKQKKGIPWRSCRLVPWNSPSVHEAVDLRATSAFSKNVVVFCCYCALLPACVSASMSNSVRQQ